MVIVLVVLGAVAVLVIAAIAVGGAVGRLAPEPARRVFEHDEALAFVVDALPDEITAALSFDDVARILRLHLDFLHRQGVARSGGDLPDDEDPVVLDVHDGVRYVLRRGELVDFHPDPAHVAEVLTAQLAYFEAIGVLSEAFDPLEPAGPEQPPRSSERSTETSPVTSTNLRPDPGRASAEHTVAAEVPPEAPGHQPGSN